MRSVWAMAVMLGLGLALPAAAAAVEDDDLAVVKRATKQEPPVGGGIDKAELAAKERAVVRPSGKPQWLRVRVVEKSGRKKISVNLPLALVRALGDDFDLGILCGRHHGRRHHDRDDKDVCPEVRLADVLAALDSGEDLVQVDEEDATVRIWVE
jgi:hypothetical protein